MTFPTKEIPDQDELFLRVHQASIFPKRSLGLIYKIHGGASADKGLSCDWMPYSSLDERMANAKTCKGRAKAPMKTGIFGLNVGRVRLEAKLRVIHSPVQPGNIDGLPPNEAHAEIRGDPNLKQFGPETLVILDRIAQEILPVPPLA